MIQIRRLNAQGGNGTAEAVIDYMSNTEALTSYYVGSEGMNDETMRWYGKGAEELNLNEKPFSIKDMAQLAKGFDQNGKALCQNAGEKPKASPKLDKDGKQRLDDNGNPIILWKGGHRIGFDMPVSAPKPVSVLFAIADTKTRGQILQAHREAVKGAMGYLESKVETRRDKGGKTVIGCRGLVISQHDHLANREIEPDLHTHNLIYGVAQGEDGKWGTFDASELYRHRHSADQIYKAELANGLKKLGFSLEQIKEFDLDGLETGRREWTIKGVDKKLVEHFSQRTKQITDYMEEHGVDKATAWKNTRKHKNEPSPEEMFNIWQETAKSMNLTPDINQMKQETSTYQDKPSDAKLLKQIHDDLKISVFCEHDLITAIGYANAGRLNKDELFKEVQRFKEENNLVKLAPEKIHEEDMGKTLSRKNTETRYCAPWMLDIETSIINNAQKRKEENNHYLTNKTKNETIKNFQKEKGFQLSAEQKHAVDYLTQKSGGVAVLSGLAGTGKTTISEIYKRTFEKEGFQVKGCCISNAAAKKLQGETGIKSQSVAKMLTDLDKGRSSLSSRDVVVLDEAGMIDNYACKKLMDHCNKSGAKLIMQGDREQIQPVGVGSGMSLVQGVIGDAKLTEIRRQKRAIDRNIAKMFYDFDDKGQVIDKREVKSREHQLYKSAKIFNAMEKNNNIDEYNTKKEAMDILVKDVVKSKKPIDDKLVLVHTHEDASELTKRFREHYKKEGLIDKEDITVKTRQNQRESMTPIAKGDRMMFLKNDNELGINNSQEFKVEGIKENKKGGYDIKASLIDEDPATNGRKIMFNTDKYNQINHSYAKTIHKAQGQGKSEIYHLANVGMLDNQAELVAFTRLTDGKYTMYGSAEDIDKIKTRLGTDRMKENALDAGIKQTKQQTPREKRQMKLQSNNETFDKKLNKMKQEKQQRVKQVKEKILQQRKQKQKLKFSMTR